MRLTSDYAFELPAKAIAQVPAQKRDHSRLLQVHVEQVDGETLRDRQFREFAALVPDNAVLVVNDTKVIRARLHTRKTSGGAVELLVLEPVVGLAGGPTLWRCLAKASKAIRAEATLHIVDSDATCRVAAERDSHGHILVEFSEEVFPLLEAHGELPLPPYIGRNSGDSEEDRTRYQTVYAKHEGAIAAPTAGLHFSEELFASLKTRGIEVHPLTLHVGLGTFAPVRVRSLDDIELHEERYEIPESTALAIESGRPVVAIGTTVVRSLESAALGPKQVKVGPGRTSIFISPGYQFQVVDHLLTNFHLPQSTLLMLVCAFAGYERVMAAYNHAVDSGYRFYSYGDAMWLSANS